MRETQRVTFYRFDLIFAPHAKQIFSLSPLFPCHQRLLLGLKLECKCGIVSSWLGENCFFLRKYFLTVWCKIYIRDYLGSRTCNQSTFNFLISTRQNITVKNSGKVSVKHFWFHLVFVLCQADFISLSPLFPRRRRLPPGLAWL